MSLDELIAATSDDAGEPRVAKLVELLREWKADDADVNELVRRVERYFGNAWIEDRDVHARLYAQWCRFRADTIERIGGMTMNERLYYFGLFDRYDRIPKTGDKRVLYSKLLARE